MVNTAYVFTDAEITMSYEFSIESLYCSTEDIRYLFAFTENGVESATNRLFTIDTASK